MGVDKMDHSLQERGRKGTVGNHSCGKKKKIRRAHLTINGMFVL